jgi:ABC-type dipeptide/oligopeptide/nickel transport system permease subunit
MFLISIFKKIAGKLRLTLPFFYLLIAIISTFFTSWTTENEQLVLYGLYVCVAISVLSWLKSLKDYIRGKHKDASTDDMVTRQIQQAKKKGVSLERIYVDEQGIVRHQDTNEPIV